MHLHTIRISEMFSLHHIDYTYVSVLLGTLFIGFASCKQYLLLLCFCFFSVFIQSDVFCTLMWVYSICIWFFYWCLWTHSYSLILCFVYSAFLWFPPHPTSPIFLTTKGLIKFALFLFFLYWLGNTYIYGERGARRGILYIFLSIIAIEILTLLNLINYKVNHYVSSM